MNEVSAILNASGTSPGVPPSSHQQRHPQSREMSAGAGTGSGVGGKAPSHSAGSPEMGSGNRVEIPKDQPRTAQAAAPVATLSSKVDPWPHYLMSGACAGAGAYSYNRGNPRMAAFAGAFSLAYLFAGRLVVQGHEQLGYDVGTITSIGVLATALPAARASGDTYSVAMSALGGVSGVANFIKSYQMRTGKPHEMEHKR